MASLLALDPYVTDWLNLLTRWLHVIAGIVWIGSSFYFIALDNHLRPPQDEREREAGIGGETWEIHGGGFYNIKKYLVTPRVLPETLHWFKWEAYTTWLSGFALMIVLYYLNADTYLIDKSVADHHRPEHRADLEIHRAPAEEVADAPGGERNQPRQHSGKDEWSRREQTAETVVHEPGRDQQADADRDGLTG